MKYLQSVGTYIEHYIRPRKQGSQWNQHIQTGTEDVKHPSKKSKQKKPDDSIFELLDCSQSQNIFYTHADLPTFIPPAA